MSIDQVLALQPSTTPKSYTLFAICPQMDSKLALVYGSDEPQLYLKTMGTLIDDQAVEFEGRHAVVFPWQSVRLSYRQLADRSKILAKAMLEMGLSHGDCVGIMAGNCYQYIEVFLGGARIGCPVVVLNNTYSPAELENAVRRSCKLSSLIAHYVGGFS